MQTLKKNKDFSNETLTLICKLFFELSTYEDDNSLQIYLNSDLIENLILVNFYIYFCYQTYIKID